MDAPQQVPAQHGQLASPPTTGERDQADTVLTLHDTFTTRDQSDSRNELVLKTFSNLKTGGEGSGGNDSLATVGNFRLSKPAGSFGADVTTVSPSSRGSSGCCGCFSVTSGAKNLLGSLGSGLAHDIKRRAGFYLSDFTDGILGDRSFQKTISTTTFLYFSVLLPCIAFGVVDTHNTNGQIDPTKTMIGQAIGGLFFGLLGGQPMVVVMTTAPLCIYIKVIYLISQDLEVEFLTFYASVGFWMCAFLVIMSVTNCSNLMKYCTRSTEDIFALFTAFAFGSDGIKEAIRSFKKYYWEPECTHHPTVLATKIASQSIGLRAADPELNSTTLSKQISSVASVVQAAYTTSPIAADSGDFSHQPTHEIIRQSDTGVSIRCQRETCILFLFLMCGTLWLANSFSGAHKTPYLSPRKRDIIKDYALAISVLIFSFVGSYIFSDIRMDVFEFTEFTGLQVTQLTHMSTNALMISCLLGFMLSVLFYIDQNICGAMVNNAPYKLKKGNYFHLDLLVLAALNLMLSFTGLPWMHGKLPHSHLHSKALADYEETVDEGHIHRTIVNIRETRLSSIFCSFLVAISLVAVPYPLSYIPLPVLSGVFLYTALAEFKSNSMVDRISLLITEEAAYPPNHYTRKCPRRKIHLFTLTQVVKLVILSIVGFYPDPHVNMAFPIVVATFVPIRDILIPKFIDSKYLNSLDSPSLE